VPLSQFQVFNILTDFYEIWCKRHGIGWHASSVMFIIQQLIRTTWHLSGEGNTVTWRGIRRSPCTDYDRSKTNISFKRTAFFWVITRRIVVIFLNFGSLITNGAKCTHENKSRTVYGKSIILQREKIFTSKLNLKWSCSALKLGHFGKQISDP